MFVWIFIVFLFNLVHLLKPIDIRCPDISQWKLKEKGFCNTSAPDYYCLLDENNNTFTEFCTNGSEFTRPGFKIVVSGDLNGKPCSDDFFQPFKFWTNYSSECVMTKSNCSEEGQFNFNNGNTTSDRACRCNSTNGYDFVHKPNNECFCYPEYEDCSCYFRSCGHDYVLTPDYQCMETTNWTGDFKCTNTAKESTRGKQQVEAELSSMLERRCFWCKQLDGKDTYHKSSQKEDIKMFVFVACALLVMSLSMTGYHLLFPKCFKAVMRYKSKRNFEDTFKRRFKANYYDIITTIDYEAVTKYLISKNILNDDDLHHISERGLRRKDKNQELLQTLWKRNKPWIDHFIHALQNNGYSELANQINETRIDNFDKLDEDLSDDDDGNKNIPQYNRELNTRYIKDWVHDDKRFIPTTALTKVDEMIKEKNCVLVVGDSREGKTSLIRHLAVKLWLEEDYDIVPIVMVPVIIRNFYNAARKQVFVVDDFCGRDRISETFVDLWVLPHYTTLFGEIIEPNNHLDQKIIPKKDIKILIACNSAVYKDSLFDSLVFYKQFNVLLSDWPLSDTEKKGIMQKKFDDIKSSDSGRQLEGFKFSILCKLSHTILSDHTQIRTFFEKPSEFLKKDIKKMKKQQEVKFFIISLLSLLDNKLNIDWLDTKSLQEWDRNSIECISAHFKINLQEESSKEKIKVNLDRLEQSYIIKSDRTYRIVDEKIYDIAAAICGKSYFRDFVNWASSKFIAERYILEAVRNESDEMKTLIVITLDNETIFFERLIRDLENGNTYSFLHNRQLKDSIYREKFLKHCQKESIRIKNILANIKEKQNDNTSQKDQNVPTTKKVDHEDDMYYIKLKQMDRYYTTSVGIPLIQSVIGGYIDIVTFLLEMGSNINVTHTFGRSSLYIAAVLNHTDIVKLLIEKNADISMRNHKGRSALYVSCKYGHGHIVKELLKTKHDTLQCDDEQSTPLHAASMEGHDGVIKMLLAKKHSVDPLDNHYRTPLLLASERGHTEVVKTLIQAGSNVSIKNETGWTPLLAACKSDGKAVVELLLRANASISECDGDGRTPLLIAAINGSDEVLKLLILENVDLEKCDSQDRSALYLACKGGHETTVNILLQNNCSVNTCSKKGKSPLHVACGKGNVEIVQALLNKDALIEAVDCRNRTALHVSCKKGNLKTIQLLLENKNIIRISDNDGDSPLHVACKRGVNEIANILILNGADVNHPNKGGKEPLHIACSNGHYEICDLLLNKHAQTKNRDNEGATPLLTACKIGQAQITRLLLQNKAAASICDKEKRSPLHIACMNGREDIVQALLEEAPNITIEKDNDGKTALDWASEKKHSKIIELLRRKKTI